MLLLLIFIFDSFHVFGCMTSPPLAMNMCLDHLIPLNPSNNWSRQWIPCSPPSSFQTRKKRMIMKKDNNISSFDITFHCRDTSVDTCNKARRAFERVGEMISSMIIFKQPIKVNATLASFCQLNNQCEKKAITLGGSCPSRSIPLLNKDGRLRLHPQALVKQFDLEEQPLLAPFDIISVFNVDAPFWFEEDQVPINSNQADFTFVILHEFMHGLGFYSGWNQYFPDQDIVTPDPSPFLTDQFVENTLNLSNALHTTQYIESAMDRLIHIIPFDDIPLSQLTHYINSNHSHFMLAKFNSLLTVPFTLAIKLNTTSMMLETGLKPFKSGSSISHVAFQKYSHHPDFLMRYKQERGIALPQVIQRSQGTHAIGPFLLNVFEELGYPTVHHPDVIPPLLVSDKEDRPPVKYRHHRLVLGHANRASVMSKNKLMDFIICILLVLL